MNPYVVIDIGGTSIKYGLADANGQLLETHEMPTKRKSKRPFRSLARLKMMSIVPVSQRLLQDMQKARTMLFA